MVRAGVCKVVAPVASATPGKNDQGRDGLVVRRARRPTLQQWSADDASPLTEPGVRAPLPSPAQPRALRARRAFGLVCGSAAQRPPSFAELICACPRTSGRAVRMPAQPGLHKAQYCCARGRPSAPHANKIPDGSSTCDHRLRPPPPLPMLLGCPERPSRADQVCDQR